MFVQLIYRYMHVEPMNCRVFGNKKYNTKSIRSVTTDKKNRKM